jgi:hypothetical protein
MEQPDDPRYGYLANANRYPDVIFLGVVMADEGIGSGGAR